MQNRNRQEGFEGKLDFDKMAKATEDFANNLLGVNTHMEDFDSMLVSLSKDFKDAINVLYVTSKTSSKIGN